MRRTNTIVIGGGQAGLAMSRTLSDLAVDHIVLERGQVGERWRERWDSLHLLTPRWQSRLPGWSYRGPDPDGFMSRDEVIRYLEDYARSFDAPVESGVTVTGVSREGEDLRVATDRGEWSAANVVVATGHSDLPLVPAAGARLAGDVVQVTSTDYRNPDRLPEGGVLVVGASSTGVQLADEIHRSGRPVTLAVSHHTRLPRHYRGRDIMWWFDVMGTLDATADDVHDIGASRRQHSLQLVGSDDHHSIDLGILQDAGVRLAGRLAGADGSLVAFEDDLEESVAVADAKLGQLLERIDAYARATGLALPAAEPIRPVRPEPAPPALDLRAEGIRSVVWATGYRRSYPWLRLPVLDGRGEIVHSGGVTAEPGLYVIGLQFLRCRKSSFIDGVGPDAHALARHIHARASGRPEAEPIACRLPAMARAS